MTSTAGTSQAAGAHATCPSCPSPLHPSTPSPPPALSWGSEPETPWASLLWLAATAVLLMRYGAEALAWAALGWVLAAGSWTAVRRGAWGEVSADVVRAVVEGPPAVGEGVIAMLAGGEEG